MALSNIFREPRREITESLVGLSVVSVVAYADYIFAEWFHVLTGPTGACPVAVGMIFGATFMVVACIGLAAAHALGDGICNRLGRFDPRPKVRR